MLLKPSVLQEGRLIKLQPSGCLSEVLKRFKSKVSRVMQRGDLVRGRSLRKH